MIQNSPVDNGTSEGGVIKVQGTVTYVLQKGQKSHAFKILSCSAPDGLVLGTQMAKISFSLGLVKYFRIVKRIRLILNLMWIAIIVTFLPCLVAWFVFLFSYKQVKIQNNEQTEQFLFPVADYLVGIMVQFSYIVIFIMLMIGIEDKYKKSSKTRVEMIAKDIVFLYAPCLKTQYLTTVAVNEQINTITISVKNM